MWIATFAGAGLFPVAPGTVGSAAAVGVFVLFSPLSPMVLGALCLALFGVGVWASDVLEAHLGRKDDGRIVVDEVVGQWIALAPLSTTALCSGARMLGDPGCGLHLDQAWAPVTAFVLFRGFDIWKPGPVGWAERRFAGGLGVMLDDVVAGVLAAGVLLGLLLLRGTWGAA